MIEVVAGILVKKNKVLIARRAPHKSMPGKWEFPGGKIEASETPEAALERELFEEFGVKTKTGEFIATSEHDYGSFKIKLLAYFSTYEEGNFNLTDHDQIEWVKLEKLLEFDLAKADVPIVEKILILGKDY